MTRVAAVVRGVRGSAPSQLGLRGFALLTGGTAVALSAGTEANFAAFVALVGAVGLLVAAVRPDGGGSGAVLGAAAVALAFRYGTGAPPVALTLAVTAGLYLHHAATALAGAAPAAPVAPAVLARWAAQTGLVLAGTGGVASVVLLPGRLPASGPLELVGIGAVVALVALAAALARRD